VYSVGDRARYSRNWSALSGGALLSVWFLARIHKNNITPATISTPQNKNRSQDDKTPPKPAERGAVASVSSITNRSATDPRLFVCESGPDQAGRHTNTPGKRFFCSTKSADWLPLCTPRLAL